MKLHGYFRSSATYRVRIALNLKGLTVEHVFHHLRKGEQRNTDYLTLNPQGLLPTLQIDTGEALSQSIAICEYLNEIRPDPPLLPRDPLGRALVRALAMCIACDIHPLQNLRVLQRLQLLGLAESKTSEWARTVIEEGLHAFDSLIRHCSGSFCFGDQVTLADCCLIPQLANARRFGVRPMWPQLTRIEANCLAVEAFAAAAPDRQPDAD